MPRARRARVACIIVLATRRNLQLFVHIFKFRQRVSRTTPRRPTLVRHSHRPLPHRPQVTSPAACAPVTGDGALITSTQLCKYEGACVMDDLQHFPEANAFHTLIQIREIECLVSRKYVYLVIDCVSRHHSHPGHYLTSK